MEIMDGQPPTVDSMDKNNKFSKAFKNFISKCLIKDPQKRLSAQELLSTEFIKKYAKDRQFMIDNFVKHVKRIQIKQCHEHDLPSSIQNGGPGKLLKKKSTKYQVTIDSANGDENVDFEDDEEAEFNFSTSLHIEDLENEDGDDLDEENNTTQKKGKFTVTTVNGNGTKQSKFKVTEANGNNNNNNGQQAVKKKSRFQVTTVDNQ